MKVDGGLSTTSKKKKREVLTLIFYVSLVVIAWTFFLYNLFNLVVINSNNVFCSSDRSGLVVPPEDSIELSITMQGVQRKVLNVYLWDNSLTTAWERHFIFREILDALNRPLLFHWMKDNQVKQQNVFSELEYRRNSKLQNNTIGINADSLIIAATELQNQNDLERLPSILLRNKSSNSDGSQNVGLLHYGDEYGSSRFLKIAYPLVDYIMRPFYIPRVWDEYNHDHTQNRTTNKILWVPNGYKEMLVQLNLNLHFSFLTNDHCYAIG